MGITFSSLSSGSAGNCIWVNSGDTGILIDCGLSALAIRTRLVDIGVDISSISAVVCSHGHGDHVRGAAVLARRYNLDIFGTEKTLESIRGNPPPSKMKIIEKRDFSIGGIRFWTVPTLHDSPDSSAFVMYDGETRLGVLTDLGKVTESIRKSMRGLDGIVLEMNHDDDLLMNGPYPYFLKKRIRGSRGHLSNSQGAEFLESIAHPGLQHITLAHLSVENNRPEKALDAAGGALFRAGIKPDLIAAGIEKPTKPYRLHGRGQISFSFA